MIKIEKATFEHLAGNIKIIGIEKIRERILAIEPRHKIIIGVLIIALLAAVFAIAQGNGHGQSPQAAVPSMDELLSNNKAEVKTEEALPDADNPLSLDKIIDGIKSLDLFALVGTGGSAAAESRMLKVPQEFISIQQAVDKAKSGDVVLVAAGEYKENITIKNGVSVVGENAETVILDGEKKTNVVTFKGVNDINTRFENFTVKNSGVNLSGILIEGSSPIINRNIFLQNDYDIYIKGESSPVIQRNVLKESKVGVQIFNLNEPKNSHPSISDNLFFTNKKGINIYKGSALIEHNTISFNSLAGDSGATFGIYLATASAVIKNNIVTDNGICELCSGIYADETSKEVSISFNNLWNNQNNFICFGKCVMETNNISEDPLFEDGLQLNLNLKAESPFLKAGGDGQKLGARL